MVILIIRQFIAGLGNLWKANGLVGWRIDEMVVWLDGGLVCCLVVGRVGCWIG